MKEGNNLPTDQLSTIGHGFKTTLHIELNQDKYQVKTLYDDD
jgi:hypothetical protein